VGGSVRSLMRILTVGWVAGRLTGRSLGVLVVQEGPPYFTPLADLCVRGEVRVHVHRTYPLELTAAALAEVGEGRALGKVVVAPAS
jgi:NADPH:quinone reductase-like Zn-dependent oxidoreductase